MNKIVNVIGDSHTKYFNLKKRSTADRMRLSDPLPFSMRAEVLHGASLTGLRSYSSTMKVRERIDATAATSKRLCLSVGQVDLELGYYFRQVIKGETWSPESYVDYLLSIYKKFLSELSLGSCDLSIKGVNLSVLSTRAFAASYVSRILTENIPEKSEAAREKMFSSLLNERAQNDMHILFNDQVRELCSQKGHRYFDVNDYLAAKDAKGAVKVPATLDGALQPMKMDHHVVSTVEVFRQHYFAIGKAFDLIDDDWVNAQA